jgi:hypothetical protein
MAGEPDPNWPRQAWRAFLHEWAEYARAAVAVTRAPVRVVAEWAAGERELLNPFYCLLNAVAIVTAADVIVRAVRHTGDLGLPNWLELLLPALSLFNAAVVASLIHFPLRLLGGRGRWRSSFGASIYVNAGPMVPLQMVHSAIWPATINSKPTPAFLASFAMILLPFAFYLVATLSGALRVRWWRAALATAIGALLLAGVTLLVPHR